MYGHRVFVIAKCVLQTIKQQPVEQLILIIEVSIIILKMAVCILTVMQLWIQKKTLRILWVSAGKLQSSIPQDEVRVWGWDSWYFVFLHHYYKFNISPCYFVTNVLLYQKCYRIEGKLMETLGRKVGSLRRKVMMVRLHWIFDAAFCYVQITK